MSDDGFMEEDEEFDFQYSGSEEEEMEVDSENRYYEAKGLRLSNQSGAIAKFQSIVLEEVEKGEWGFKALKQLIKISFGVQDYDTAVKYYTDLLGYTAGAVSRNASEKSMNSILDYVSMAKDMPFMEKIYEITLGSLRDSKNDRLYLKCNLKLAKLWLDRKEYPRLKKILRLLHQSCKNDDGSNDQQKGTILLEIYALEIQMYTEIKDNQRLKKAYQECLTVKSGIPHPKIMGLIRECGDEWDNAQSAFFEAFKNYDEAGSPQRIQCLKYLVLANMLMESQINPFDSQETKPYANDPQIVVLTNLVEAFQAKDIKRFESILSRNKSSIMDDLFIREYIDERLKISDDEVEELVVLLILDGKLDGKIDQLQNTIVLNQEGEDKKYSAMVKWSAKNSQLCKAVSQSL